MLFLVFFNILGIDFKNIRHRFKYMLSYMTYLHMWHIKEGEIIQIYLEYEACPEGIQPCIIKNTDIYWKRYKTQDTLYMGQWCLSPLQSRHLGISHNPPNHHQLPCQIFLNLINSLKSLPFQRWFFGKKQKSQGAKSGL